MEGSAGAGARGAPGAQHRGPALLEGGRRAGDVPPMAAPVELVGDATQAEHQAIVDAIVRRSSGDAAEAIRIHILNAKRRIFESTPLR